MVNENIHKISGCEMERSSKKDKMCENFCKGAGLCQHFMKSVDLSSSCEAWFLTDLSQLIHSMSLTLKISLL